VSLLNISLRFYEVTDHRFLEICEEAVDALKKAFDSLFVERPKKLENRGVKTGLLVSFHP
jgi:hypothetical protein